MLRGKAQHWSVRRPSTNDFQPAMVSGVASGGTTWRCPGISPSGPLGPATHHCAGGSDLRSAFRTCSWRGPSVVTASTVPLPAHHVHGRACA